MSTINQIPDSVFYDPDSWIDLAPNFDWDLLSPPAEPVDPDPEPIEVTAAAPTFDDDEDTYTIPAVEGVIYLVDDEPVEAGDHSVGDVAVDITVTAEAEEGYVLTGTASWVLSFTESEPAPGE